MILTVCVLLSNISLLHVVLNIQQVKCMFFPSRILDFLRTKSVWFLLLGGWSTVARVKKNMSPAFEHGFMASLYKTPFFCKWWHARQLGSLVIGDLAAWKSWMSHDKIGIEVNSGIIVCVNFFHRFGWSCPSFWNWLYWNQQQKPKKIRTEKPISCLPTASYNLLFFGVKSKYIGFFRSPEKNIGFLKKRVFFSKCLILVVWIVSSKTLNHKHKSLDSILYQPCVSLVWGSKSPDPHDIPGPFAQKIVNSWWHLLNATLKTQS